MKRNIYRIVVVLAVINICSGWGFLVHRTINQLAIYELPRPMQPFFYRNMNYIVENAVRPDLRRSEDSTEASRHFIDLEMFGDSAAWKMPLKWEGAVKSYTKDTLLKYGYVPYQVIAMQAKLTHAFGTANSDSILFYAADLGHYIGDANVPLHTSVNYDGQLSNQKGLHGLWESMIPEIELDQYSLKSRRKAHYLSNPEEAIWEAVRRAHLLLKDVFSQEKEATSGFSDTTKYRVQMRRGREVRSYTTEFAKAYSERLGRTIHDQLWNSADLIADFWYTAWVDAGKPDLTDLVSSPEGKKEKKAFRAEWKAFHRGELVEKKLLIARKLQTSE